MAGELSVPKAYSGGYQNAWAPLADRLSEFGNTLSNRAIADKQYAIEQEQLKKLDPTTPEGQAYAKAAVDLKMKTDPVYAAQVEQLKLTTGDMAKNRAMLEAQMTDKARSTFKAPEYENVFVAKSAADTKLDAMDKAQYAANQANDIRKQLVDTYAKASEAYNTQIGATDGMDNFAETKEGLALRQQIAAATQQAKPAELKLREDYRAGLEDFFRQEDPTEQRLRLARTYGGVSDYDTAFGNMTLEQQKQEQLRLANIKAKEDELQKERVRVDNAVQAGNAANYNAAIKASEGTAKVNSTKGKEVKNMSIKEFKDQTGLEDDKATTLYNKLVQAGKYIEPNMVAKGSLAAKEKGGWFGGGVTISDFGGTSLEQAQMDADYAAQVAASGKVTQPKYSKAVTSYVPKLEAELKDLKMTDKERAKSIVDRLDKLIIGGTNTEAAKPTKKSIEKPKEDMPKKQGNSSTKSAPVKEVKTLLEKIKSQDNTKTTTQSVLDYLGVPKEKQTSKTTKQVDYRKQAIETKKKLEEQQNKMKRYYDSLLNNNGTGLIKVK